LPVGNTPKNRETEAARLRHDDDDDSSSAEESLQMSHISGKREALQNSSSAEKQESSTGKEWMFEGTVSMSQFGQVEDGRIPDDEIQNFIQRNYQNFGEDLELTFSQKVPVKIECCAILSDSQTVRWNGEKVFVSVRGYVAGAKRATRQAWEESVE
jgi:hypothetical protein